MSIENFIEAVEHSITTLQQFYADPSVPLRVRESAARESAALSLALAVYKESLVSGVAKTAKKKVVDTPEKYAIIESSINEGEQE